MAGLASVLGRVVAVDGWANAVSQGMAFGVLQSVPVSPPSSLTRLALITPAAPTLIRARFTLRSPQEEDVIVTLREGDTVTAPGAVLVPVNFNRQSDAVSSLVVEHDPTVTEDGIALISAALPSGVAVGGQSHFLLSPSTTYILKVEASVGTLTGANLGATFFEDRSPEHF